MDIADSARSEVIGALQLAAVPGGTSLATVLAFAFTRWLYASERLAVSHWELTGAVPRVAFGSSCMDTDIVAWPRA